MSGCIVASGYRLGTKYFLLEFTPFRLQLLLF
jgi:hypothetical protein